MQGNNEAHAITAVEQDILNRLPEPKHFPPMPAVKPNKCAWTKDEDGIYTAACHRALKEVNSFIFTSGGPVENRFTFCPYCGRPIKTRAA